jgi:hypothetical protein
MHSVESMSTMPSFALEDRPCRAGRQTGGFGAVVARHVDLVGKHIGILAALDVHHAPKARTRRKPVLVLAGDLAGAAADAVHVVVDEAELHRRLDRHIGLAFLRYHRSLDLALSTVLAMCAPSSLAVSWYQ